jgi:hypothetical protein
VKENINAFICSKTLKTYNYLMQKRQNWIYKYLNNNIKDEEYLDRGLARILMGKILKNKDLLKYFEWEFFGNKYSCSEEFMYLALKANFNIDKIFKGIYILKNLGIQDKSIHLYIQKFSYNLDIYYKELEELEK